MKPVAQSDDQHLAHLVERAGRRDEAAFEELYRETSSRVYGLALRIVRSPDLAEDVLVDVYDQIWHQADRFDRERGTVRSWIALVARTRAVDLLRSKARQQQREGESLSDEPAGCLCDAAPGPLGAAQGSERAERLQAALQRLPAEQHSVIMAAFFGGLSHGQISKDFGQPLGTVKTRIRLGLASLRKAFATADGQVA